MKIKLVLFMILLSVFAFTVYAQNQDLTKIPVEIKTPIKVYGTEVDEMQFYNPSFIKYNKHDGNVYVCDAGNHRIIVLDTDLNYLYRFGKEGQGPGEFTNPFCIAFDNKGNVIVQEIQRRIQVVNSKGEFLSSFVNNYSTFFINCDNKGHLYVNGGSSGNLIVTFDRVGSATGKFGELLNESDNPLSKTGLNKTSFVFDEQDNFYCAFYGYPVLRKYDSQRRLLFEKNYKNIPGVEAVMKKMDNVIKMFKERVPNWPKEFYETKRKIVNGISVDDMNLYITLIDFRIYVFDKNNGEFVKIIVLNPDINNKASIRHIDFSDSNFIYAIDSQNMLVLKYEK